MKIAALELETVQKLAHQESIAPEMIEPLLVTLTSSDEETRAWTSDALCHVTVVPDVVASKLKAYCLDSCAHVASWSCKLLLRAETKASALQDAVAQALMQHPDLGVRQSAALALRDLDSQTPLARRALEEATHSTDPRLQRLARQALEKNAA